MQLASILSILCNIQHLAQQQSPRKLQWFMLWKWTFRHFRRADTANRQSGQPNDVIMRTKAWAVWKQRESEHLGHCAAGDQKRSLRRRNDEKRTFYAMKRKRNGLRIMLREKPLGQESEWKIQRQWFSKNSTIWRMLKSRDWRPESPKDVCRDAGCYRRQSEWSCKFRQWGEWGRWGWWRDWAGQAERRWRTQLGDGYNLQNGTAPHGEVSAEADEVRRIDSTGMGGCSWLLQWTR